MAKHLYNSRVEKVKWFVKRFGASEMIFKPLRTIFAPLIIPTLPARTFDFEGKALPYLYHRYNMTWASERCVEVPIARSYLPSAPSDRTLEVGNVLSHYGPVSHAILDKFEKGPGVINEDIVTFKPVAPFDLIISISTFEHIGFDDEAPEGSAAKILQAIDACRRMLTQQGKLVITIPINYNPELDHLINDGKLSATRSLFLKQYARLDWRSCLGLEAMQCRYKIPFPYANAIMVAEFSALTRA